MPTKTGTLTADDRWFLGSLLQLKAGAAATGGSLTLMEQQAAHGFSPPRHRHSLEDTALYVLDGRLSVEVDGEVTVIRAGHFAWLPREVTHSFRVDSATARFIELATPGGVEVFHHATSMPAEALELPPKGEIGPAFFGVLAATAAQFGIDIVGPPMEPLPDDTD